MQFGYPGTPHNKELRCKNAMYDKSSSNDYSTLLNIK